MISVEDVEALLDRGREQLAVEFKGPGRGDDRNFLPKVARACIAMSNLRDGGIIIVGIENSAPLRVVGLDDATCGTWLTYDHIAASLARYCDPPISFDLAVMVVRGVSLAVLEIDEFHSTPTLAAMDYPGVLEKGLIYVRGLANIESTGHPSGNEIRLVLDLAIEKGVRRFVEVARRGGLWSNSPSPLPSDAELYERQLGELA